MNQTMTIRKKHLPIRCEICHQSDMFNAETISCNRCNPVVSSSRSQITDQKTATTQFQHAPQEDAILLGVNSMTWSVFVFCITLLVVLKALGMFYSGDLTKTIIFWLCFIPTIRQGWIVVEMFKIKKMRFWDYVSLVFIIMGSSFLYILICSWLYGK